jgi:hypothetical protein
VEAGYRPNWDLGDRLPDGDILFYGAQIGSLSVSSLAPGSQAEAELQPLFPEGWPELAPGTTLDVYEGRWRVGTAVYLSRSN